MAKRIAEMMESNGQHSEKVEGREKKHEKLPQVGIAFEFFEGGKITRGSGGLYGALLGFPVYDPAKGVQFVFEGVYGAGWDDWERGSFLVTMHKGRQADPKDIYALWHLIGQARVGYIREGELVERIEVTPWEG